MIESRNGKWPVKHDVVMQVLVQVEAFTHEEAKDKAVYEVTAALRANQRITKASECKAIASTLVAGE